MLGMPSSSSESQSLRLSLVQCACAWYLTDLLSQIVGVYVECLASMKDLTIFSELNLLGLSDRRHAEAAV